VVRASGHPPGAMTASAGGAPRRTPVLTTVLTTVLSVAVVVLAAVLLLRSEQNQPTTGAAPQTLATVEADLAPDGTVEQARRRTRTETPEHAPTTDEVAIAEDEVPLVARIHYEVDGRAITAGDLDGHTGEAVIAVELRNVAAQTRSITYGTPEGLVDETVEVAAPLTTQVTVELGEGWSRAATDDGSVSVGADGGTQVRWQAALFPPIGSTTARFALDAVVDGATPPRITVEGWPVSTATSPTAGITDELLTEQATADAVAAVVAAGLQDVVGAASDGADGLVGGLEALQGGVTGALDQLDDLDPEAQLDDALAGLGDQLDTQDLVDELLAEALPELPDTAPLDDALGIGALLDDAGLGALFEEALADSVPDPSDLELDVGAVLDTIDLDEALGAALDDLDLTALFDELLVDVGLSVPAPDGLAVHLEEVVGRVAADLELTTQLIDLVATSTERIGDPALGAADDPGPAEVPVELVSSLAERLRATAEVIAVAEGVTFDALDRELTAGADRLREAREAVDEARADNDEVADALGPSAEALEAAELAVGTGTTLAAEAREQASATFAGLAPELPRLADDLDELVATLAADDRERGAPGVEAIERDLADFADGLATLHSGLDDLTEPLEVLIAELGERSALLADVRSDQLALADPTEGIGLDAAALFEALDLDGEALLSPFVEQLTEELAPDPEALAPLLDGAFEAFEPPELDQLLQELELDPAELLETAGLSPEALLADLEPPDGTALLDALELELDELFAELGVDALGDVGELGDELIEGIAELSGGADELTEGLQLIADEGLAQLVGQLDDGNRGAQRDLALLRELDAWAPDGADATASVRYQLVSEPDDGAITPARATLALAVIAVLAGLLWRRRSSSSTSG
jgi:hypothetical protein